jgi:hypothetical protein
MRFCGVLLLGKIPRFTVHEGSVLNSAIEGESWLRPGEYLIAVVNYDNAETADITGTMQVVAHIIFEAD